MVVWIIVFGIMGKNCIYSVKSGYKVAMELLSCEEDFKCPGDWDSIWKLKVPPRVEMFLWRLGRDCLPNRMRIQNRGVEALISCGLYDMYVKYAYHHFLTCSFSIAY